MCPIWPGQPITAHWGVRDPAAVSGSDEEKRKAFVEDLNALWMQNNEATDGTTLVMSEYIEVIGTRA